MNLAKLVIAALLFPLVVMAAEMKLEINAVTDGDTIATFLPLPCPLCRASVRIRGIDTPEKNHLAKCPAEAALGKRATDLTKALVGTATMMTVSDIKWDKYGGRMDGYVVVNGKNIGNELIKAGLARPYDGKKKSSWCS